MSESSEESREKRRPERSPSEDRQKSTKLFITNLDGKVLRSFIQADTKELEDELRKLFEKYGTVESLVAKRNRNAEYCFAFAEMKEYSAAQQCVKTYGCNYTVTTRVLGGKQIKVQFQDDGKRRKDSKYSLSDRSSKGCFTCGKMGHFARECQSGSGRNGTSGVRQTIRGDIVDGRAAEADQRTPRRAARAASADTERGVTAATVGRVALQRQRNVAGA